MDAVVVTELPSEVASEERRTELTGTRGDGLHRLIDKFREGRDLFLEGVISTRLPKNKIEDVGYAPNRFVNVCEQARALQVC
jgi:hypothetical protein